MALAYPERLILSSDSSATEYHPSETRQKRISCNGILAGALFVDLLMVALYAIFCIWIGLNATPINLDREANIPTWWSSAKLLVAGGAFGLVGFRNIYQTKGAWLVLCVAAVLVAMSLDETASLHERIGFVVDLVFGSRSETVFDRTGLWFVVVGLPFAVLFGFLVVATYRFLETVPNTVFRLAAGMAILLTGALGVEAITNFLGADRRYFVGVAFEEGLEMAGGSILLWAGFTFLLRHKSMQELRNVLRPLRA